MSDTKKFRIAIAGFQHETNTFMPTRAQFHDFERADSWPEMVFGPEVVTATKGINLPIAGAAEWGAQRSDVTLLPILWCAAEPSGPVTDAAFDRITQHLIDGLKACGPIDGVYLDLHGAMVTESFADGETQIIERVRSALPPDTPIAVSLDLHANISAGFVKAVQITTIFRTYPHLDMDETGARAISRLVDWLNGDKLYASFRQVPFLIPLHAQNTGAGVCQRLYAGLGDAYTKTGFCELALGFTAADVPDCGASVLAYAENKQDADNKSQDILDQVMANRDKFDTGLLSPSKAIEVAQSVQAPGPAILADVQDNPGAGASSDTTGILRALANAKVTSALLGVMHDPDIAKLAHEVGVNEQFQRALGGKSGVIGDEPYMGDFTVLALSDGKIPFTGDMYGGSIAEIGPSCLLMLTTGGARVHIVVSSDRTQCLDRGLFTHFGIEPRDFDIVSVKSTVHFRADFEPGARAILNVAASGGFVCDLEKLDYQNLRQSVQIR